MLKKLFFYLLLIIFLPCLWVVSTLPNDKNKPKEADHIRLVTANIYYENKVPKAVATQLVETQADIISILELRKNNIDIHLLKDNGFTSIIHEPRKGTHGTYLGVHKSWKAQSSIVKSPVKGPCNMPIGTARLSKKNRRFSVLTIHAPPIIAACKNTNEPNIKAIANWIKDGKLIKDIGSAKSGDPVFVLGDLNALPFSEAIQALLTSDLQDTYKEANFLPGATWSPHTNVPAISRIDYIFSPQQYNVVDSWIFTLPGSDHRGVAADIQLKN